MDMLTLAMAKAYSDSKGGYTESQKVSILDVSLAEDAETPGFTVYRDLSDATPFELGNTYTVHLDSGSYECVAKAMDGIGNVLGNTAFGGGADTGETFLVAITGGIAMVMDANCGTKASVTTNVETIVPIDQKYLPGVYEKTMLYDGTPTKMDLSAAGMGYAYLLSGKNLFALARGQNVHFEYTLANGTKAQGVLDNYDYMKALAVPMVYGAFTLLFSSDLGGTGVSFNYADIGEIANLKLWTEYSENKPYYVTGYYNGTVSRVDFIPVELEKAKAAAFAMRLMVRYKDNGGNTVYYIPTEVFYASNLNITVTRGEITVTNDYVSAGW